MSTVGSERQHQAARALIAQIVKNSDLYGADAIEEERLNTVGQDEDGLDSERGLEQAFESHRDSEYSGGVSSAGAGHRDQVQAAFENYGQITEEILAEWKEMFSLFESVGMKHAGSLLLARIRCSLAVCCTSVPSKFRQHRFREDGRSRYRPSRSRSQPDRIHHRHLHQQLRFQRRYFRPQQRDSKYLRVQPTICVSFLSLSHCSRLPPSPAGKIDFPTFYRLMTEESPMPGPCHEAQVLLDFHVFDMHRDGFIPVVDLVHLLRNLGEPLTRDDVDCLLAELYIDGDNKINIKDLVRHMFTTSAPNPE
jgi:hypothetical protein